MIREADVDPSGTRTLGIVTKPDTLDQNHEKERQFFDLVQNKVKVLSLGWHVLRNLGQPDRAQFPAQEHRALIEFRDMKESDCFVRVSGGRFKRNGRG